MKSKVICNLFNCKHNYDGYCSNSIISIDEEKGCTMYRVRGVQNFVPIPDEEEPPSLRSDSF